MIENPTLFDEVAQEIQSHLQNRFPSLEIYGLASDFLMEGRRKPLIYWNDFDYIDLLPNDEFGENGYCFQKIGEIIEPTNEYWQASNLSTTLSIYFWVNLRTLYPELKHLPEQDFLSDLMLFFKNLNLQKGAIQFEDIKTNQSAFDEYVLDISKMYPYNAVRIRFNVQKRIPCEN